MEIRKYILNMPKSELHLHLRGAILPETFLYLTRKYSVHQIMNEMTENKKFFEGENNIIQFLNTKTIDMDNIVKLFHFTSFDNFLKTYMFVGQYIRDISDFDLLVEGVLLNLRNQNIVYAEIIVSLTAYINNGISIFDIDRCLKKYSSKSMTQVNWIVGISRIYGPEIAQKLVDQVIKLNNPYIVGINLGGNERLYSVPEFSSVFKTVKEAGLKITVHAGEICDSSSVIDSIHYLRADRIGHGISVTHDERVMQYLSDFRIPLEICPTSNLCTGICSGYAEHPLKTLYHHNVNITISSDDPSFFNSSLVDEYIHLYTEMDFSIKDIIKIVKNGFIYSFLKSSDIKKYIKKVNTYIKTNKWDI